MFRLIFVVLIFACISGYSQAPFFLEKSREYYDNNQYREALYYLNKFISLDSANAEAFKWRGNCYSEFNQLDSALLDYRKALKLNPDMHEVNFNMGLVFAKKNATQDAEDCFRKYLARKTDDADAIFMLGHLKTQTEPDSALYFMQRAYSLDPTELRFQDALISEYLSQRKYQHAYELVKKARKLFPHHFEFRVYHAYAAYTTGHFKECSAIADSLLQGEADLGLHAMKIKSDILANTRSEAFTQDGFTFKLPEINSNATETLDKWVIDPSHAYNYQRLLTRFRKGEILGLDEYFMVYYGFTSDERYSPYGSRAKGETELYNNGDFAGAVKACTASLTKDEFNPGVIELLFLAQREIDTDYEGALRNYLGIIEGILATGDGTSFESAYVVTSPHHEYDILSYLGYKSQGQSLHHQNGHIYDVLRGARDDENERIHFNIDKPFRSLSREFRANNSETEKKKGRKKKQK